MLWPAMVLPTAQLIVAASAVGNLERLEPLARRIFGPGDRPLGWFARKLRRECVDPSLSVLAVRAGANARDSEAWLGYVLVGTPESLRPALRTAGTGVLPAARRTGLGTRLLDEAAARARAAGYRRMQLLAASTVVPFYRERGFSRLYPTVTALAFARGPGAPPLPAPAWCSLDSRQDEPIAWLPEAWAGTDPPNRFGHAWSSSAGPITAWLSWEGRAILVQRLVAPHGLELPRVAAQLLTRLPRYTPVLMPMLPVDAPATQALLDDEWSAIQSGALLERPLITSCTTPRRSTASSEP